MEHTTYILQKDLPNCNAGAKLLYDKKNKMYYSTDRDLMGRTLHFSEEEMPLFVERGWFKKEEPKQLEWQICAVRDKDGRLAYTDMLPTKGETIEAVKRLSDNEVLSIGGNTNFGEIRGFILRDETMYVDCVKYVGTIHLSEIQKSKPEEPLPIKVIRVVPGIAFRENDNYSYGFLVSDVIPEEKIPDVKKAIELILNIK